MNSQQNTLRIGDVAASCGLTVDAVRYYERVGLLAHEARTSGGFRTYSANVIERLAFIRQAQRLGLRLREIRELLGVKGGAGRQHCQRVRTVLVQRLEDVEQQMKELKAFRRTLKRALENCDTALAGEAVVNECPVVRSLAPKSRQGAGARS
jgi:MerR family transcriptional regulator, Zn(II)-responsive regulator of zntA